MNLKTAVFLLGWLISVTAAGQILFDENFTDEADGATSGTATGGTWNVTTAPLGTFSKQTLPIVDAVFYINNTVTEGVLQTSTIDISATGMATISVDLVTAVTSTTDYIRAYYRVDGGPEILFAELLGQFLSISTVGSAVVTGSSLQIVIRAMENTPSVFSTLYFDNLTVSQVPVLYSCTSSNWNLASSWSTVGFTGPCNASSPPTTAQVAIIGGGHTIDLTADANVGGVDIRSTGILRYTATNVDLGIELGFVRVQSGGFLNHNSQSGAQIDFNQPVGGAVFQVDAGGIATVEDVTLTTNANSLHYLLGGGILTITDDILIGADNATLTNNRTSGLAVGDRIEFTAGTTGAAFINNTVVTATGILFDNDNNTFTNNGNATFTGDLAANGTADDGNAIVNNAGATLSFASLDGNASGTSGDGGDMTIVNYGIINQSGTFVDIPNNTNATNDINNMNGAAWNYAGTGHDTHLRLFANNGTNNFVYTGASQQIITPEGTDGYSNLTLQGSGAKTALGNFTVYGNWTRIGTATFTPGTFTVTFADTVPQTLTATGTETFNNLTFNNSSATSPQITFNNAVVITNTLSMVSGIVNLSGNTLTLGTSPTSTGTLSHSLAASGGWLYNGTFTRYMPTTAIAIGALAGFYPMGSSSNFRPFFVGKNNIAGSGGAITVGFTHALTTSNVSIADGAATITRRHDSFWTLVTSGITAGTWSLRAGGTGFGVIEELPDLRMSTTTGVVGSHGVATGSVADPRVNRTNLTATQLNNNFHVASTDATNSPLPVELVVFRADVVGGVVQLYWRTASETQNDFFTVERSETGETFTPLGRVNGQGSTSQVHEYFFTDSNPVAGVLYYRLRQTDFDGTFSFSDVISVNIQNHAHPVLSVFPNPAGKMGFTLQVTGVSARTQPLRVHVFSVQGHLWRQFELKPVGSGRFEYRVPPEQLPPPGVYFIQAGPAQTLNTRLIIVDEE